MQEQHKFWQDESYSYFKRNYEGKDLRAFPHNVYLEKILDLHKLDLKGGSVLDIGCCPGVNLLYLKNQLGLKRCFGIDPSEKVVSAIAKAFPEMEFKACESHNLPFKTGEFDLVLLRSVLHWVDRNYLLQTLGEALRVTSGYLIISDFAPHQPYSTVYHHQKEYRTFKMDYVPLIEASGFMKALTSVYSNDGDEWSSVRTSVFRKLESNEAFPIKTEADFKRG